MFFRPSAKSSLKTFEQGFQAAFCRLACLKRRAVAVSGCLPVKTDYPRVIDGGLAMPVPVRPLGLLAKGGQPAQLRVIEFDTPAFGLAEDAGDAAALAFAAETDGVGRHIARFADIQAAEQKEDLVAIAERAKEQEAPVTWLTSGELAFTDLDGIVTRVRKG